MQVFVGINLATDLPYWIKRDDFFRYFDQGDFMNREVKEVQLAYLKDWFYEDDSGAKRFFYIPVAGAIGRRTDLISSRHRLAVLLPYLEDLPIAFATAYLSTEARTYLDSIPRRHGSATFFL